MTFSKLFISRCETTIRRLSFLSCKVRILYLSWTDIIIPIAQQCGVLMIMNFKCERFSDFSKKYKNDKKIRSRRLNRAVFPVCSCDLLNGKKKSYCIMSFENGHLPTHFIDECRKLYFLFLYFHKIIRKISRFI